MSINFSAFEIGRRALNANQVGINVTGQNIANVNTQGYTRQQVVLKETTPFSFNGKQYGTGVTIESVQSFRDRFIETRLQTENGIAGGLSAKRDTLAAVENVLQGGVSGGLQNALESFFNSFSDLEASPNSLPLRTIAAQKGSVLANTFQTTRSRLVDIRQTAGEQIQTTVDDVNTLSSRIADLNVKIRTSESDGSNASTLRDERGELLNQLSEFAGIHTSENQDGTINVTIGEGQSIVVGDKAVELEAQSTNTNGVVNITINGQPAIFDDGKIRGLQDSIASINTQIGGLDDLASALADRVNQLHTSGTDLDGNAGVSFFDTTTLPVTAANIKINPAITANPRLVVASAITQPANSGTVAGEIANLLTDKTTTIGTKTGSFSSVFSSNLAEIGTEIRNADNGLQTQAAIIAQVTTQRQAVSGVSIDEEAINLLQYQKAFEAAARFIKVADEMTQTILSLAQ